MRSILAAATLFLTASLAPALPAQAAETRLTAAEITDIARRELLWCESYEAATDDCEVVTLVRITPDNRLAMTSTILLTQTPNMQIYIADTGQIDGDRVCSKFEAARTQFVFTMDGQPAPEATAAGLRLLFLAQLQEFEGKTMCQAFFRGDDPMVIREEITVDGERRTDLESTYRLYEGGTALKLRPQITETEQEQQVHT